MRVLYVCTANICRSASAALLLREAVIGTPGLLGGIEVRSAGTDAMAGSPVCSRAPALVGRAAEHRSQPLTADLVAWADLILPAARDHRPAILELDPRSRTRTFTIRQAGRLANWLVDMGMIEAARERSAAEVAAARGSAAARAGGPDAAERAGGACGAAVAGGTGTGGGVTSSAAGGPATDGAGSLAAGWTDRFAMGDPRREVEALPEDPAQRWHWVVREMDAARGLASATRPDEVGRVRVEARRRFRLGRADRSKAAGAGGYPVPGDASGRGGSSTGESDPHPNEIHPDDVPDPHFLGTGLHPLAYEQIASSTAALVRLLRAVGSIP